MRQLLLTAAMILVLCGLYAAFIGVVGDGRSGEKSFVIGLVLILGSGVFAILYLGSRGRSD
jgi:hypothetical protein